MSIFEDKGLFFVPLGGSEQFGVNLNVYVCDGKMLAVDCGIGFADERFPGIDLLLPDPEFIEKHIDALQGIIITHAHEDHIGALAYLWERIKCPVYASPFTAEVLRRKFEDQGYRDVVIDVVEPGGEVQIDAFEVRFVSVSHSVPDTCGLLINTAYGQVMHSGDWNLDPAPVVGVPTDEVALKAAGDKGVLAYIGDSTNAEVNGYSGSEADVEKGLEAEFKLCNARIAVTSFSSNIGRIISIARAAKACGRQVGVIGRSLHRMIACAHDCGMMEGVDDFVSEEGLGSLPDDKVVVIVTGSQGEYRAALGKISRGEFKNFSLKRGDTVIFSARAIPGNEVAINAVKNNLSGAGVNIITPRDTKNIIHVSGHPCRDEITQMFQWLKPDVVVPVHGERVQLQAHAELAQECQVKTAIVPSNGSVVRLAPGKAEVIDHVETGVLAVDQKRIIKADHQSISARRKLQYTGAINVAIALNKHGEIMGEPGLETVGLLDMSEDVEQEIEDQICNTVIDTVENLSNDDVCDDDVVQNKVRIALRRFCQSTFGLKPHASVHVIRV